MKIKLHFNRINMQRGDARVWSAHTAKSCNMSDRIQIKHRGKVVAEAVFEPQRKSNPRAWIEMKGQVTVEDGITIVHLDE